MNVVRLRIDQIVKLWSSIRFGIISAVSPIVTPDGSVLQLVLCQLIKEQMQCWCIHNDEKEAYGYLVTSLENIMGRPVLNIYSEYTDRILPTKEDYEYVIGVIDQFARANGCHRITGFSADPGAISLAEKFGFSSHCRILIKEV